MQTAIAPSVINEVLQYIQYHLSGNLSLEKLARYAGYSSFHLHRLIKERTGDSLGNYIKTKRIETAAFLLYFTDQPIGQIRELVGYTNKAAFSKAFLQLMGCAPREFRKHRQLTQLPNDLPQEYLSLEYRIERRPDWQALAFPSICNYFDKALFNSWKPVNEFLAQAAILPQDVEYWGVIYECPNVSGKSECRFDASIVPVSPIVADDLFNTKYKGGKFAVFRFCAPHTYLKQIALQITQYIVEETPLELSEGLSFFKYLQSPTPGGDFILTDWYIPIQ